MFKGSNSLSLIFYNLLSFIHIPLNHSTYAYVYIIIIIIKALFQLCWVATWILFFNSYLSWAKSSDKLHFFKSIFTTFIYILFSISLPLCSHYIARDGNGLSLNGDLRHPNPINGGFGSVCLWGWVWFSIHWPKSDSGQVWILGVSNPPCPVCL